MIDVWQHVLKVIEPEYEKLLKTMQEGPSIIPLLEFKNNSWFLTLEELWGDEFLSVDSQKLDDRLTWAKDELSAWPNVIQTAWNQWIFISKKEAEKFLVVYHLTWEI